MATYLKNNAVGVDKEINSCIKRINRFLNENYSFNVDIYHKVYRERTTDGVYAPYVFVSDKDYKEVFLNDKTNGEVAFYLNNTRDIPGFVWVDCNVIFSINLDKIDNGSLQREDEKAMLIALAAVQECGEVSAINTGLENVFSDFNTDRIKFRDMQPYFNFSFSINLTYKNSRCYDL